MVPKNNNGASDKEKFYGSTSPESSQRSQSPDASSQRAKERPLLMPMSDLRYSDLYGHSDEFGRSRYLGGDVSQWVEQAVFTARAETRLAMEREMEVRTL